MAVHIDDCRDAFALFDKQGLGKVECCEIGNIMRALGLNPTESSVKKIVSQMDTTGQKSISLEEFVPLFHTESNKKSNVDSNIESISEGFRIFDRENNGLVSVAEVRHLLTSLGESLSAADVDELVAGMEDQNGMINYEEFVRAVMNG